MKNKMLICLSLFAVISLTGCLKKGDDDPLLSLRSRKGRVAGDWKVVSFKQTTNFTSSGNPAVISSQVITSDGKTYTEVSTVNGASNTETGDATQTWKFEKDGKYSAVEVIDGEETKRSGRWNFTSGVGDTKNKSQLTLSEESSSTSGVENTYSGNYIDEVYDITELRNKTMVLYYHRTVKDASGTYDVEYQSELEGQ